MRLAAFLVLATALAGTKLRNNRPWETKAFVENYKACVTPIHAVVPKSKSKLLQNLFSSKSKNSSTDASESKWTLKNLKSKLTRKGKSDSVGESDSITSEIPRKSATLHEMTPEAELASIAGSDSDSISSNSSSSTTWSLKNLKRKITSKMRSKSTTMDTDTDSIASSASSSEQVGESPRDTDSSSQDTDSSSQDVKLDTIETSETIAPEKASSKWSFKNLKNKIKMTKGTSKAPNGTTRKWSLKNLKSKLIPSVKSTSVKSTSVKSTPVKPNLVKPNPVKSNPVKSTSVKPNPVKPNLVKSKKSGEGGKKPSLLKRVGRKLKKIS